MEELQKELQKLQSENDRLRQAKNRLLTEFNSASEKLATMERTLPELMAATALDESPAETLDKFRAEIQKLKTTAQEPIQTATKIIDTRIKSVLERMGKLHQNIAMTENKTRYQAAKQAIAAKGFYTVIELDELEHLASNSGDLVDCSKFKQAIDDYRSRYELHGRPADFPAFGHNLNTSPQ